MNIFDGHCDVLFRMNKDRNLLFDKASGLHINYDMLKVTGGKSIQCFALFVDDVIPQEAKYRNVLDMIDLFHQQIIEPHDDIIFVQSKKDIDQLEENQIGAMLTLEGCDAIEADIVKLRTLFRLGVRSVGLTWNHSNASADGALEPRGAGLSKFGFEVVNENNKHKVWTDVSHLCERSFWDVLETAKYPIASHSNARALCDHPRNLTDEQAKALFQKNGVIGVTFVPHFLTEKGQATMDDILRHIEHFCECGGEEKICFGSDFDGIEKTPVNLNDYSGYTYLTNELLKHYPEKLVKGFLFDHFYQALPI